MERIMTKYEPTWESLDNRPIPEWFEDAKFGIFIHWGVYSVPAWRKINDERFGSYAEWYYASVYGDYRNNDDDFHNRIYGEDFKYREFVHQFNAELFDPDFWAKTFKEAGAKYVVLTSKHHEGYCLWPTDNKHKHNWRVTDVGPNRDLVGDLTKSVRNQGLKMGLYYSIIEWETNWSHRPESGYFVPKCEVEKHGIPEADYPDEILIPQLKELVTKYKPSLIFSDGGEWDFSEEYSKTKEFLSWLYNEAPNRDEVVVNDRFCVGMPGKHGDYFSSEYKDVDEDIFKHPWEESRGIGKSYGFNRAENLDDYLTSEELVHELVDIVGRGGNFLLNVGPTADGRIPVIQQQRLRDIGNWLSVNGEAIYSSRSYENCKHNTDKLYFTSVGDNVYAICVGWPEGEIVVPYSNDKKVKNVSMLGLDSSIVYDVNEKGIVIKPLQIAPSKAPCEHAYVYKVEFEY